MWTGLFLERLECWLSSVMDDAASAFELVLRFGAESEATHR